MKKHISQLLCVVLLLCLLVGCGLENAPADPADQTNSVQSAVQGPVPEVDFEKADKEMFTDRDKRTSYDESAAVKIQLNGSSATTSSNGVNINGTTVQITEEATYIISGRLDDGMLVVNAPDTAKLQLVFDGVDITSSDSAALYILGADKVFITLAEKSQNSLSNGGSFAPIDDENIDAALYAKQDLTINGTGKLTVTSPAGHGIVGKDDLVITGGNLQISAAGHAVDANDSVRFTNTLLTATAGKDGIHCENNDEPDRGFVYVSGGSMDIQAEGDGISAGYYLHITDGTFDILAGGGYKNGNQHSSANWGGFPGGHGGRPGGKSDGMTGTSSATDEDSTSMKGIKSAGIMQIDGGTFTIDSADDSMHSDASMIVNGGIYQIASGDDAMHAEDTLTVNDGIIRISTSYEGMEALHVLIAGGDIDLVASDDGLNAAGGIDSSGTGGRDDMFGGGRPGGGPRGFGGGNSNGSIVISGGKLKISASGDGIDANGTLEITGGYTIVVGPTRGDTATLDYDVSGTIAGGTFIGTGASNMAQTFSSCEQGVISVSVGNQDSGTQITLTDDNGKAVISYAPELDFQVVILSSPDMVSGETYTICVGSQSGQFEAS